MSGYDEQRIAREEETWTGPKLIGLMIATLAFALLLIYTMSSHPGSQPSQSGPWNWHWDPWGADPESPQNLEPSSVSGLVR